LIFFGASLHVAAQSKITRFIGKAVRGHRLDIMTLTNESSLNSSFMDAITGGRSRQTQTNRPPIFVQQPQEALPIKDELSKVMYRVQHDAHIAMSNSFAFLPEPAGSNDYQMAAGN